MTIHVIVTADIILINVYFGRVKDFHSQWKQLKSNSQFFSASGDHSFVSDSLECNNYGSVCSGFSLFILLERCLLLGVTRSRI